MKSAFGLFLKIISDCIETVLGAGFQALDMAAQGGGRGDTEDKVDAVGAAPVQHLRAAVMGIRAEQDGGLRPIGADRPQQTAQEGADFHALGALVQP